MHIDFGWEFDGTPWDPTGDSFARAVCGPRELVTLLATRLGLSRPDADHALRIAGYRAAAKALLAQSPQAWFAESFHLNPWAMSATMLSWRDFLVEHGWTPAAMENVRLESAAAASDADASSTDSTESTDMEAQVLQRLRALAAVEGKLGTSPAWQPGFADLFREVLTALETVPEGWPLGICSVRLHAVNKDSLPEAWRRLFALLRERHSVAVDTAAPRPRTRELRIVTAQTVYEGGVAAARILSTTEHPWTVLAGAATAPVDAELTPRGLPRLGVAAETQAPLLPVFLGAVSSPRDVRSIITLLTMEFPSPTGPQPLIPRAVARRLRDALAAAPGVGQDWAEAAQGDELAEDLDHLIRLEPLDARAEHIDPDLVIERLTWLDGRLAELQRSGAWVQSYRQTIASFVELLRLSGPVHAHEFSSMVDSLLGTTVDATAQACPRWTVTAHPAHLPLITEPGAALLWWAPINDTVAQGYPLTELEVRALHTGGIAVPTARQLAALSSAGQMAKLSQFERIIAVFPEYADGEATRLHPLMNVLADAIRPAATSLPDTLAAVTCSAQDLLDGSTWQWDGAAVPTVVVEQQTLPQGNPVLREFEQATGLVPERISFSQIDEILHHPLEWLFEYRLGIRPSSTRQIASGNAMIGTLMHKVHENLADRAVTAEAVAAEFDALVPEYAASLELPENEALRVRYRETTVRALTKFAELLDTHGVTITGREHKFTVDLPELADAAGQRVEVTGFRDVDISTSGRTGVVDLKFTNSAKKYEELIRKGEAVQLAVYARSLSEGPAELDRHPVTFYSLAQQRFFPAPGAGVDVRNPEALTQLWERVTVHLNRFFEDLRAGQIFDVDAYRILLEDAAPSGTRSAASIDPEDPRLMDLLVRYSNGGCVTEEPHTYTKFDFLTGKAGDFQ